MAFPELYEHVSEIYKLNQLAQGKLPSGSPRGVTVHYSAERDMESTVKALAGRGLEVKSLGYHLLIDRAGRAIQLTSFSHRVYHAGHAMWNGSSPNSSHIAVSLLSYGLLKRDAGGIFTSWFGEIVPKEDAQLRPNNVNGRKDYWDAATFAQEVELYRFLRWCVTKGIDPENICGHDECAVPHGRKVDPGGVLSGTMAHVRDVLHRTGDTVGKGR